MKKRRKKININLTTNLYNELNSHRFQRWQILFQPFEQAV